MVKKSVGFKELNNSTNQSGPSLPKLTVRFNSPPPRPELFIEALTHSSYAHEHKLPSNERLEFLGDSVLSLVTSNFLFQHFKGEPEGRLSKLKATIVSATVLADFTLELGLDQSLRLGGGELKTSGKSKLNILADLFEAFLGAYFLNYGLRETTDFLEPLIRKILPDIQAKVNIIDSKTQLQELAQARGYQPSYRTVKEEGPPHNRTFTVELEVGQRIIGTGVGKSLKEAQSIAAAAGIATLLATNNQ